MHWVCMCCPINADVNLFIGTTVVSYGWEYVDHVVLIRWVVRSGKRVRRSDLSGILFAIPIGRMLGKFRQKYAPTLSICVGNNIDGVN